MANNAVASAKKTVKVGIDFGTHGCGFMHTTSDQLGASVREFVQYPDQPYPSPKTLTTLLYKNGAPVSWGWTAAKQLLGLSARERQLNNYVYLKDFKLALQEGSGRSLPKDFDVVQVVADYLHLFSSFAIKVLQTSYAAAPFHAELVQWCVTVPANWDEVAKHKMRLAVHKAGMTRGINSDSLIIVLEPEAAALVAISEDSSIAIQPGDHVVLVDAGGGTVDVTSHTATMRGGRIVMSETTCSRGGFAGSVYIDQYWREYYKQQVGPRAFDEWSHQHPGCVLQLEGGWERIKCSYSPTDVAGNTKYVPVPESLLDVMGPEGQRSLAELQEGYDDRVYLGGNIIQSFFDPVVDQVVTLVKDQLDATGPGHYTKLLVVGGFAESPYLVQRIREVAQGHVQDVIVPSHPQKAVVQGAVIYGCRPELIHARCCRLTYGVPHCAPHFPGAPDKLWDSELSYHYTSRAFTPFVTRGQEVQVDEEVRHTFFPMFDGQTLIEVPLYATDSTTAQFVPYEDGPLASPGGGTMQHLATMEVHLPVLPDTSSHVITVTLRFGRTQVSARAVDESTGHDCATQLVFAPARQRRSN